MIFAMFVKSPVFDSGQKTSFPKTAVSTLDGMAIRSTNRGDSRESQEPISGTFLDGPFSKEISRVKMARE